MDGFYHACVSFRIAAGGRGDFTVIKRRNDGLETVQGAFGSDCPAKCDW